jgi:hypothetical protein
MLSAKQLLLKQTAEAIRGRADMPLMASLDGITQEEASWQPDGSTPSIEQIVRHVAWAKSRFCQQGFGCEMVLNDDRVNGDGFCGFAAGVSVRSGVGSGIETGNQRSHRAAGAGASGFNRVSCRLLG